MGFSFTPGLIAALVFIAFTGIGYLAQVVKLFQRRAAAGVGSLSAEHIADGLHPTREFLSFLAFTLFALSGLTRTYFDYVLVFSRLPVVILSTVILWFLAGSDTGNSRKLFRVAVLGNIFLFALLVIVVSGHSVAHTQLPTLVDWALAGISVLLFYGKSLQAYTMYREQKSAAVSWLRELGLILKDMTGLYYALGVGAELKWVALTHTLSFISSSAICIAKYLIERAQPTKR